jgi:acyl dehydratase
MPIDPELLTATRLERHTHSWSPDDVILYHLGLGAGAPPDDPGELAYTYETGLKVLPSFGVIPAQDSLLWLLRNPGFDVPHTSILHGEQEIEILQPLAAAGEVRTDARVSDVYDKGAGNAAIVVLEATTRSPAGEPLFVNRFTVFARGEGGCGGSGSPPPAVGPPDRERDLEAECATVPQQALLYRLCGDKNPLHADPELAARAGFERPILHGLCTYGIVCRAVVDAALGGDVARVKRYSARFAGIFYPGETMSVRMWCEDGRIHVTAFASERAAPVLTNGVIDIA